MSRAVLSGRMVVALLLPALAFGSAGCWFPPPDKSVLVVLRGGSESARWEATNDLLPYLADDLRARQDGWTAWGGRPPEEIRLAPVADPKAFADRVQFGAVEWIEGRTIYIRVDDEKTKTLATLARVAHFFEELPDQLRAYWLIARVKAIAWWTGRSEGDVFWSVFWSDVEDPNKAVVRELERQER
jgi:hypothetical protein